MLRAHQLRCAALIGGYARTAEAQALVRTRLGARSGGAHARWCARAAPRVTAIDDSSFAQERDPAARTARLPSMALDAARTALAADGRCSSKCHGGVRARTGLRQVPHHRPLPPLHRTDVAARPRHRRCRLPVVRSDRVDAAVRAVRFRRGPRRRGRRPTHRRGAGPGVSRHHRHHVGRRRGDRRSARRPGARRRHPGAEPRVPRAATARRCCSTAGRCSGGRTCARRGRAAALDGRRRAGPAPRRRRPGRGRRRVGDPDRAGPDPLGSGRARRVRTRGEGRSRAAARRAHGRRRRQPGRGRRPSSRPRTARRTPTCSGPSTCRRRPGARSANAARRPGDAGCWCGCRANEGLAWRRRCAGPPGCSARDTTSSPFVFRSIRCT